MSASPLRLSRKLLYVDDQVLENELGIEIHTEIAAHLFDIGASIEECLGSEPVR
jgi:hypothetical protein